MADRSDYPGFVAGCWTRLLRTAYLLVQDWAAAEDLTQAALVLACWPAPAGTTARSSGPPLPIVVHRVPTVAAYRWLAP